MPSVSKRELNQHTAAALALVTASEDLIVTERGTPRWRVSVVAERESTLARLEREGRYTPPAANPAPWPDHPGGPRYTTEEVDALLDETRGDH
jgi:antitoxin (DNA-binding transcriptional repressor) of toxin-antitoxin stability system